MGEITKNNAPKIINSVKYSESKKGVFISSIKLHFGSPDFEQQVYASKKIVTASGNGCFVYNHINSLSHRNLPNQKESQLNEKAETSKSIEWQ